MNRKKNSEGAGGGGVGVGCIPSSLDLFFSRHLTSGRTSYLLAPSPRSERLEQASVTPVGDRS